MTATVSAARGASDQPPHLLADPFAESCAQAVARRGSPHASPAASTARAVLGVEAEEAEDAQPVLGDPLVGVADEADAAGARISA